MWFFGRVYHQEALCIEFKDKGIHFEFQPVIEISYKHKLLEKKYQPVFICFDEVIVELKAL